MIGIDSSILIDILRGNVPPFEFGKDSSLCTSEIVVYEVFCGLYGSSHFSGKKIDQFEAILDTFTHIFPLDRKASVFAAQIFGKLSKEGHMIQHSDALIAGSLLANGCTKFLTKNVKDFERIKDLEIL
ncbi:MAG TPA: type II toxin-antitoxin system VapC family toxin [Candidatus Nanoarchaeia archaeon]|nr:type II toxin-antitoxin system VapC family toxin [Candidatus Nanoarchaeia archaeon]